MKHFVTLCLVAIISFVSGIIWNKRTSNPQSPQKAEMPVLMGSQSTNARSPLLSRLKAALDTTATANNGNELSSEGPTSEEIASISELAQKSLSGQYVLHSENPFVLRKFNENVTNQLAELVPGIILTRASLLSDLGVSTDTIYRLTNHVAKIAEASLRYGGPLSDLQMAKADYIAELKTLLTPEQYDAYENVEKQHAVAHQTGIKFDGVSPEDARNIINLYESLNLDGVKESFLPYEGLPNVITGGPEITNILKSRLARLTSSRETLDAVMSSRQYSPEVVGALQTFIDSQIKQDAQLILRIQNPVSPPNRYRLEAPAGDRP